MAVAVTTSGSFLGCDADGLGPYRDPGDGWARGGGGEPTSFPPGGAAEARRSMGPMAESHQAQCQAWVGGEAPIASLF